MAPPFRGDSTWSIIVSEYLPILGEPYAHVTHARNRAIFRLSHATALFHNLFMAAKLRLLQVDADRRGKTAYFYLPTPTRTTNPPTLLRKN